HLLPTRIAGGFLFRTLPRTQRTKVIIKQIGQIQTLAYFVYKLVDLLHHYWISFIKCLIAEKWIQNLDP
ncbi:hypothetical protein, partial [Oceanobacillus caeni]|uniref:hypothetical protein n=1 Tax=Oceanobacillus caeni TaxID=405946 RepID=UPI0036300CCB